MSRNTVLRLTDNPFVNGPGLYEDGTGAVWDIREVNHEHAYVYAIEQSDLFLENNNVLLECNRYSIELT